MSSSTGWTPEQIAARLRLDGSDLLVSHETIYQFAYSKDNPVSSDIFPRDVLGGPIKRICLIFRSASP